MPFVKDTNDGYFFIEDVDFMKAFTTFDINSYHDTWVNSYYEVLNDVAAGTQRTFSFTIKNAQELYASVNFYDARMYSYGCKT